MNTGNRMLLFSNNSAQAVIVDQHGKIKGGVAYSSSIGRKSKSKPKARGATTFKARCVR